MHIFDAERPEVSPGRKALLLEGSALPVISVFPIDNTMVQLSVLVRDFSDRTNRSYHYKHLKVTPKDVPFILEAYIEDPEHTLKIYFGWEDQRITSHTLTPSHAAIVPDGTTSFDLL